MDLWLCQYDGKKWGEQLQITNFNEAQSSKTPAMASYREKIVFSYVAKVAQDLWSFDFVPNSLEE